LAELPALRSGSRITRGCELPAVKKLIILLVALILPFSGCSTVSKVYKASTTGVSLSASKAPGIVRDDKILIYTEQALSVALDTFDTFLKLERANEDGLRKVSPEIHVYAEKVRKNGKGWIKSAEKAHDTYRDNRTDQNYATLITAYRTLQTAIQESRKYLEKHGGV
jgi:uncharacterized protein YceK